MVVDNNQLSMYPTLPAMEGLYGTRTSHRWANEPGQLDLCNLRCIFPSVGPYDMPSIAGTDFEPSMLAAFHLPKQRQEAAESGGAIHFFLDDYRFERVWRNPDKHLEWLDYVGAALTPDFSIYTDTPFPTQLWQVYRQRWMGAWWQYNGITVIPAVRWAEPNTYDFVFEGLPEESVIAIGVPGPGSHDHDVMELFRMGLEEMLKRLRPSKLLTYGQLHKDCEWLNLPPVRAYPTFWQTRGRIDKQEGEPEWQKVEREPQPPDEDGLDRSSVAPRELPLPVDGLPPSRQDEPSLFPITPSTDESACV